MKKLLGISIFVCLFFNNIAAADYMFERILKFNEWLNINGYEQYLDKDKFIEIQDKSICNPNVPQVCVDSDGKFIPYEQYKYKRMYQNNLKIKLNKKKTI